MAWPRSPSMTVFRLLVAAATFLFLGSAAARPSLAVNVIAPVETSIGRPFLVFVSSKRPLEEVVIFWEGKEIPLAVERSGQTSEAMTLLGTDVGSSKPGAKTLEVRSSVGGKPVSVTRQVNVRHVDFPVQKLSLPQEMVDPPREVLERIARERKETARALSTFTRSRVWAIPFVRSVPGKITSPYGFRRILNDQPRAPHRGVDYRAAEGDPVRAAADGTVVLSAEHYYAGQCIYLDHGGGVVSVYMHLSSRFAEEGETLSAGDIIGLAGRSGRVTGPHLHFGLSLQGMMVDPEPLLES